MPINVSDQNVWKACLQIQKYGEYELQYSGNMHCLFQMLCYTVPATTHNFTGTTPCLRVPDEVKFVNETKRERKRGREKRRENEVVRRSKNIELKKNVNLQVMCKSNTFRGW